MSADRMPTSRCIVKQLVSQLKDAIRIFAGNNPELTQRIERLVAQEKKTFDRRFGRMAGASGG